MTTDLREVAAAEPFDADTDLVFGALADADRRFVLARLVERTGEVALGEIATDLAAWQRGVDAAEVGDDAVESEHAKLYHIHAPKLADAGLVSVNGNVDTVSVSLAADAETVREHVDLPAVDA